MTASSFYTAGLVLTALFGFGHFTGFLQATRAARHDPDLADLTRSMRQKKTRLLGFEASILDFREYFSLNFSILLWMASASAGGWPDPATPAPAYSRVVRSSSTASHAVMSSMSRPSRSARSASSVRTSSGDDRS